MINPASVAFDFDGVIADTMSLFLKIACEEFHVDGIRYEDITCYNLAECIGMDPEIIEAIVTQILDGRHRAPLKPIEGAPEVLARIGRYHRPVLFVTARPYVGPICDWLLNLLPLEAESLEVVATGTHERKADILLERQISCFVEDRLETCYALYEVGIVPIVFKQPWNRERHPFVEVGSWDELEALIAF
jgi:5'(3')-deoxyribonucleotidase